MKRQNDLVASPSRRTSLLLRLASWLIRLRDKHPAAQVLIQRYMKLALLDMRYGVTRKACVLLGVGLIVLALIGVDGWTDGKELWTLFLGLSLLAITAWTVRSENQALLRWYAIEHGGITEWRNMVFDIRESYLDTLHSILENDLPGITIHGRYEDRFGESKETEPTPRGQSRKWENRPGKYLRAICWIWTNDEEEVRLEYRRVPGNIYAARFFQSKGLTVCRHNELKAVVDRNEWSCEPNFGWICRLGVVKIAIITAVIMTALLWGGRETMETLLKTNITSNEVMNYARWTFLEAGVVTFSSLIVVFARRYYFPAGVFRIDEEKRVLKLREKSRSKVMKWILGALGAIIITMVAAHLTEICTTMDDGSTKMGSYLRQTNMCELVRNYISPIEQLNVAPE